MLIYRLFSSWKSQQDKNEVAQVVLALLCNHWAGALFIAGFVDGIFAWAEPRRREKRTEKEQCLPDGDRKDCDPCSRVGDKSPCRLSGAIPGISRQGLLSPTLGCLLYCGGALKSIMVSLCTFAMSRRRRSFTPWGCLSTSYNLCATRHGSRWWSQLSSPYVLVLHLQPCSEYQC